MLRSRELTRTGGYFVFQKFSSFQLTKTFARNRNKIRIKFKPEGYQAGVEDKSTSPAVTVANFPMVPYHRASITFYKAQGLWTDKAVAANEAARNIK